MSAFKISRGWVPKVKKKSRKRPKKSKRVRKRTFLETFFGLLGPRAWEIFRNFFETFWPLAPGLLLPGPRNFKPIGLRLPQADLPCQGIHDARLPANLLDDEGAKLLLQHALGRSEDKGSSERQEHIPLHTKRLPNRTSLFSNDFR